MTTKKRSNVVGLPKPKPQPEGGDKDATVIPFPPRSARVCETEGCGRPHQARGKCMRCYRLWRKTNGINADLPCTRCQVNKRWHGHSWCRECNYARQNAWYVERYRSDPRFMAAMRLKNMGSNFALKVAVIEGYGGRCVCCGETAISMLELDHVDGGGNVDRATAPGGWSGVYRRARREGFPPDLQCLCCNCNRSKAVLGRCAHEIEREQQAA